MFEKRAKGAELSKRVSYFYIVMAIIVIVASILLNNHVTAIVGTAFYIVMFVVVYLLSTKYHDNENTWIFLIVCAVATALFSLSILGIGLAILLCVAANDMRKELDYP